MKTIVISAIFNDEESAGTFISCVADNLKQLGMLSAQQTSPDSIIISAVQPKTEKEVTFSPEVESSADDARVDTEDELEPVPEIPDKDNQGNDEKPDISTSEIDSSEEDEQSSSATEPYKSCAVVSIDSTVLIPTFIDASREKSALCVKNVQLLNGLANFEFCGITVKYPLAHQAFAADVINSQSLDDLAIRVAIRLDGADNLDLVLLHLEEQPADEQFNCIIFGKDLFNIIKSRQEIQQDVDIVS